MHLVGFIIRIYHDARSSECQILKIVVEPFSVFLPLQMICDGRYSCSS